ncbi:unnamed protein product [Trichobilharzia szidati]|nr:unnamed protein product [Trichobilharzia szidati]
MHIHTHIYVTNRPINSLIYAISVDVIILIHTFNMLYSYNRRSFKFNGILLLSLIFLVECFLINTDAYTFKNIFRYFHKPKCGYQSCNLGKPGYLNVHLVPHTHDDVGWLKTVDQYYYGANNTIQRAGVQYILDSVIQALIDDPNRKFTYVEMAFFMRWWTAQTLTKRQIVKDLVQSGRLQFALGGWSMADEATVYYGDAIDQLTLGRDMLKQLFGKCGLPLVAWQIDPFGHSRDHSDLLLESGYDGVYFQRMDYREKSARKRFKQLEVLWDTGVEMNETGYGLFTSMFHDSYCYPKSFCFDDKCLDEPIKDDPTLEGYNVKSRVDEFLNYINTISKAFKTNHVMVLMGCDFTYENANINYKNMDKLIAYTNQRQKSAGSRVNLLYSTPACYTKAVNEEFNQIGEINRRGGDFFPYASGPHSYWTGYYTSRPALKYYVRQASNLLSMCEQVHLHVNRLSYSGDYQKQITTDELIDALRKTLGVLQHHDAVAGTEKQHVADDYAWRVSKATKFCQLLISQSLTKLLPTLKPFIQNDTVIFCNLLNISLCEPLEGDRPYLSQSNDGGVFIILYNPLAWIKPSTWLRLPLYIPEEHINNVQIILKDLRLISSHSPESLMSIDENLKYQLIPITGRTLSIPERNSEKHSTNYEIIFNVKSLSPMGFNLLYLAVNTSTYNQEYDSSTTITSSINSGSSSTYRNLALESNQESANSDEKSQSSISKRIQPSINVIKDTDRQQYNNPLVITMKHLRTGKTMNLSVELMYYFGENSHPQPSGAYIFLPKYGTYIQAFHTPTVNIIDGPCVKEYHLQYASWASLVVRHYNNDELEVEWTAGPIPDDGYINSRELVIRYTINDALVKNSGEFFTDSSGRRLIRRLRNKRVDWNLPVNFTETENIAGNYYPVINRIMLKNILMNDGDATIPFGLAVYTDRAEGGTSLHDGQIEIMLHRRLMRDDGFGVGEPLMESGADRRGLIVRGVHRIRFDELKIIESEDRIMAHTVSRPIFPLFMPAKHQPKPTQVNGWSGINIALPKHIHLLTLTSWPLNRASLPDPRVPNQILIRLENLEQPNNNQTIKPCRIDVTNLIKDVIITGMKEMTLTADQLKAEAISNRLKWPNEANLNNNQNPVATEHKCNTIDNINNADGVILKVEPGRIATYVLDYIIADYKSNYYYGSFFN